MNLVVDPARAIEADYAGSRWWSGIYVRARHPEDGWGSYPLESLTLRSLAEWLRRSPQMAERTLAILLNYDKDAVLRQWPAR